MNSSPRSASATACRLLAVVCLFPAPVLCHAQSAAPATTAAAEDPVQLPMFEVTAGSEIGYRSTQTTSGSGTLANLRDTPNSISVVNRELIDDLLATDVAELSMFSITGEAGPDATEATVTSGGYVFRGIRAGINLRNGLTWFVNVDSYNIERVEVLRGPTAFLYGEGAAGGAMNQLTKQPLPTDFQKLRLITGSHDLYRLEFDLNRRLSAKSAVLASLAYQRSDAFQHHAGREFKGLYLAASYEPSARTKFSLNLEAGRNHAIMGSNMLADAFSTTERTGATTAYAATTGGYTFFPALGGIFNLVNQRRSSGTNIVVSDPALLSPRLNFAGPESFNRTHCGAASASLSARPLADFHLQVKAAYQKASRRVRTRGGSSQAGLYLDTNPLLPDGSVNPYRGQYYTEMYHRLFVHEEPMYDARATAVYDLKLPFTQQRLVASATYHDSEPDQRYYSEFVDPGSAFFSGTFGSASTLAAYQANNTVLTRNYFYRRYYLRDGDRAELTRGGEISGRSVMLRDTTADGGTGRLTDRLYRAPGYGVGASGSYLNGRVHTLLGWRHDAFNQDPGRDFYNQITGETFRLDSTVPVRTRLSETSVNYGAVVHVAKYLAAYYNFAESVALSSGIGGNGLIPGSVRGPGIGDGHEYGLRWNLLGGRLESNWTYYETNAYNIAASPAVPVVVRQTELGALFTDINPAGADTQATEARGFECETVANPSKDWRLTWNFSTNKLATIERYPALRSFQARARAQNLPTPETDAFLATVPEGTPLPGFTKVRSNLITNYRFPGGRLRGFSLGGGGQYRDKSYQGNYDLDRDGFAEELWAPGYIVWNLMFGYRTKLWTKRVDLSLNVNNVFDRQYFRSSSLSTGVWNDGRNFRLAARIDL